MKLNKRQRAEMLREFYQLAKHLNEDIPAMEEDVERFKKAMNEHYVTNNQLTLF